MARYFLILIIILTQMELKAYDKSVIWDEGGDYFQLCKSYNKYYECVDINNIMKKSNSLFDLLNKQTNNLKISKIELWLHHYVLSNRSFISGVRIYYDTKKLRREINISYGDLIEIEEKKSIIIAKYYDKNIPKKNIIANNLFDEIINNIKYLKIVDYYTCEFKYQKMGKVPLVK